MIKKRRRVWFVVREQMGFRSEATPKYATLANWLFWIKSFLGTANGRTRVPLKKEINLPCEAILCVPGWEEKSLISRKREMQGLKAKKAALNKLCYPFINLLPQAKAFCFVQTSQIIVSLSARYKSCLLQSLLWASYVWGSWMDEIKFDFLLLICLLPI